MTGWNLAKILAWVPNAPRPSPLAGTLTARATHGSLAPFAVRTSGSGRFGRLQAGPVTLGDVPFAWSTKNDTLDVSVADARPFGGRLQAEATVPLKGSQPIAGSASLNAIDTGRLSASIPGREIHMTGKASGSLSFSVPPDASALTASVQLAAPDLTVQGIPARKVRASVQASEGSARYVLTAESLGGSFSFKGAVPIDLAAKPGTKIGSASGEVRAINFALDRLWKGLDLTGSVAKLGGQGAIDANVRADLRGKNAGVYAHGVAEFRDLRWAGSVPLGNLRGIVAATPTAWRIDPLTGNLLDGELAGFLWGTTPSRGIPRYGFDLRVDRASIERALTLAAVPSVPAEGFGTLRVAGTLGQDQGSRASIDFHVPQGKIAGLPLTDLRVPAQLVMPGGTDTGVLRVRRWSARLAGGHARGDAWFHLGDDRTFHSEVDLAAIDLESIARIESETRRPASGKISGRITVSGPDPAVPALPGQDRPRPQRRLARRPSRFPRTGPLPGRRARRSLRGRRPERQHRQPSNHRRPAHPGRPPRADPRDRHRELWRPGQSGGSGQHEPDHPRDGPGADLGDPRPEQRAEPRRGSLPPGRPASSPPACSSSA